MATPLGTSLRKDFGRELKPTVPAAPVPAAQPQPMNQKALLESMAQQRQAEAGLANVAAQKERAAALRDSAMPQINQYGYVSPLEVIGSVMGKERGRQQMREAKEQEAGLQEALQASQRAMDEESLRKTAFDEALQTGEAERKLAADQATAKHREDTLAQTKLYQQHQMDTTTHDKAKTYVNEAGELVTGRLNEKDGKVYDLENKVVPNAIAYEDSAASKQPSGKPFGDKFIENMQTDGSILKRFGELKDSFKDEFAQFKGIPIEAINAAIATGEISGILEHVPGADVELARDMVDWWSQFKTDFENPTRHELYGAALTGSELENWEKSLSFFMGSTPELVRKRMGSIESSMAKNYGERLSAHGVSATHPIQKKQMAKLAELSGFYQDDKGNYQYGTAPTEESIAAENYLGSETVQSVVSGMDEISQKEFNRLESPQEKQEFLNLEMSDFLETPDVTALVNSYPEDVRSSLSGMPLAEKYAYLKYKLSEKRQQDQEAERLSAARQRTSTVAGQRGRGMM